jgi:hypothetical protein
MRDSLFFIFPSGENILYYPNFNIFASGGACPAGGSFLEKEQKIARSGINLSEPFASGVGKILNSPALFAKRAGSDSKIFSSPSA